MTNTRTKRLRFEAAQFRSTHRRWALNGVAECTHSLRVMHACILAWLLCVALELWLERATSQRIRAFFITEGWGAFVAAVVSHWAYASIVVWRRLAFYRRELAR